MMRYAMSRRRRNVIAALCTLAALAVFVLDHSCASRATDRPAQTVGQQNSLDIQKYHGRQFAVVKVVDGDTIDIDIPDSSASGGQSTFSRDAADIFQPRGANQHLLL